MKYKLQVVDEQGNVVAHRSMGPMPEAERKLSTVELYKCREYIWAMKAKELFRDTAHHEGKWFRA